MIDYGRDLTCTDDFTPSFGMSTGRRLLAEACLRRLITPLGSLRRHPLYGYDVREEINNDLSRADIARISSGVSVQLQRDTRIVSCSCVATLDTRGALLIPCVIVDGAGPFKLVFSATDATVAIVEGP